MSRIFISHSSVQNLEAAALKKWLVEQDESLKHDIFLDFDSDTGIRPGTKWKDALQQASTRCEAVICILSPQWEASTECTTEFRTAENLHKKIFCVRFAASTDRKITKDWQCIDLFGEGPSTELDVTVEAESGRVAFLTDGLLRLAGEIIEHGIGPETFDWPPENEDRAPYRGWEPLEEVDAAVFFGRNAQLVRGLDVLRGMRQAGTGLLLILGSSGAGKSSFVRAGLIPRLRRDDRNFTVCEIVRPKRDVLTGDRGMAKSIEATLARLGGPHRLNFADIKRACSAEDSAGVAELFQMIHDTATGQLVALADNTPPPTLVLPVDQAEELFSPDAGTEARRFLKVIGDLVRTGPEHRVPLIVAMTMRTDYHEKIQQVGELDGVICEVFSDLRPMPEAEFRQVIEGPARRATAVGRRLDIEEELTQRLLQDCRKGADTLPLLALTLARLYTDYGGDGNLKLDEYTSMGEMANVVQTEVDAVLSRDPAKKREELEILHRAFIPSLATIDPDTDKYVRRVAEWEKLPDDAKPLLDQLAAKRLLVIGGDSDSVEVAIESLLEHWVDLKGWLSEAHEDLKRFEVLKREASAWKDNDSDQSYLLDGQRLDRAIDLAGSPFWRHLASQSNRDDLDVARDFVDASRSQVEKLREVEARRTEDEESVRKLAERRKMQFKVAAVVATVVFLAVVAVTYQWYQANARTIGLRLVDRAAETLNGGRQGGDVRALQMLLAAKSLGAPNAEAVAGLRRDVERIIENPPSADGRVLPVRGIAVSPDGKSVASANNDNRVPVWDLHDGSRLITLEAGGARRVITVAFGPDSKRIATGSDDGILQVWDAANGKALGGQMLHDAAVNSVAFSPDGGRIVTGDGNGVVRVWQADTGQRLVYQRPIVDDGRSYPIRSVAFSPDGERVASGGDDRSVRLWNARSGAEISRVDGGASVMSVAFSVESINPERPGDFVAVGRLDGTIAVLHGGNLAPFRDIFGAHPGIVNSVAFSPGISRVVSSGSDNTVRVWNLRFREPPGGPLTLIGSPLIGHHGAVAGAAFNEDSTRIISGGADGSVRIWNAITGLAVPAEQGAEVRAVAFDPNGNQIASAGTDGTVKLWDTGRAVPQGQLGLPSKGFDFAINSLAYSPTEQTLVTGGNDGLLQLWDLTQVRKQRGWILADALRKQPVGVRIKSVAFSPDGSLIATGDMGGGVRLWDGHTLEPLDEQTAVPYQVWSVAFSPDNRQVVSGSGWGLEVPPAENNFIQLWNVDPGTRKLTRVDPAMEGQPGWNVYSVQFSKPDGNRIVSGSNDGTIQLWDTVSKKRIGNPLNADQNAVISVALSADNRQIASGGADGKVRLWDADTYQPIGNPLGGHRSWVSSVAINRENMIASASADGTIRLWPALTDLATSVCGKISGNMSPEQWNTMVSSVSSYPWLVRYRKPCLNLK